MQLNIIIVFLKFISIVLDIENIIIYYDQISCQILNRVSINSMNQTLYPKFFRIFSYYLLVIYDFCLLNFLVPFTLIVFPQYKYRVFTILCLFYKCLLFLFTYLMMYLDIFYTIFCYCLFLVINIITSHIHLILFIFF